MCKLFLRYAVIVLAGALTILLAVSIGGCEYVSGEQAANQQVPGRAIQHSIITWTDASPSVCGELADVVGCANVVFFTDGKTTSCTLTLPKNSPDWLVAHEVKHCFGFVDNR